MHAYEIAAAEFKRKPTDAYWARRVCEDGLRLDTDAGRVMHARALACVASKDPQFIVEQYHLGIAHQFGTWKMPAATLRSVERNTRIKDPSVAGHVKGKLWVSAMSGFHDPKTLGDYGRRARAHLGKVRESDRNAPFLEVYCIACAWSDYRELLTNVDAFLAATEPYRQTSALVLLLGAAARKRDWRTYDRYRSAYANLPADAARAPDDCVVLNLDGVRSLRRKDIVATGEVMRALIERGRNVQFLGTPDTLTFVKALVKRRLLRAECREYLRIASADGKDIPKTFTRPLLKVILEEP